MINNLFLMLTELLNNKILSAKYLSERLEVSVRTVYRYVDILSAAAVPVNSKKGKNGGIYIGEEYRLTDTYFTKDELKHLESLRYNDKIVNDINCKIESITNPHLKLFGTVIIDSDNGNGETLYNKAKVLEKAIVNRKSVEIAYVGRDDKKTKRKIYPLNFIIHDNEWYIYCYCLLRKNTRVFKLSRITHLRTCNEMYKPEDYGSKWRFDWQDDKQKINIVFKIRKDVKYEAEEWLGIEALSPAKDSDYFIASYKTIVDNSLIYKILSFGDGIEILTPDSVKLMLKSVIEKIKINL